MCLYQLDEFVSDKFYIMMLNVIAILLFLRPQQTNQRILHIILMKNANQQQQQHYVNHVYDNYY